MREYPNPMTEEWLIAFLLEGNSINVEDGTDDETGEDYETIWIDIKGEPGETDIEYEIFAEMLRSLLDQDMLVWGLHRRHANHNYWLHKDSERAKTEARDDEEIKDRIRKSIIGDAE